MTHIKRVKNVDGKLADGLTVAAAGTKTSTELELGNQENHVTFAFSINTLAGSSKAELELYWGDNVNGNPVWIVVDSSTGGTGVFTWDGNAQKARVRFTETGGVSGLDGITVWYNGRPA